MNDIDFVLVDDILNPNLMLCSGFHARDVGRMAGMEVPVGVVRHQYILTSTIPEIEALPRELPFVRDLEYSLYSRQERQGIGTGTYEDEESMQMREDWWAKLVFEVVGLILISTK